MHYLDSFARGTHRRIEPLPAPGQRVVCAYVWRCMEPCDCRQALLIEHETVGSIGGVPTSTARVLWAGQQWVNADEEPWLDIEALGPEDELYVALWLVVGFLCWLFGAPTPAPEGQGEMLR